MTYPEEPEIFKQAMDLYKKDDFQAAYDLLTNARSRYPQFADRIYEWRMDLAAKMGKLELAEEILKCALKDGWFYGDFALRKDDDVQVLQGRPVFEALVARSKEMMAEEQKKCHPRLDVIQPEKPAVGLPPLMISLHGNNSNLPRYRPYWKSLAGTDWLLALPQSSQVGGKAIFVWNDLDTVEKEIKEHYRHLAKTCSFDPARILVSGFSKGGHAAIVAALRQWFPVRGFIGIAPYIPSMEEMTALLDACPNRDLRGYLLLGAEDKECTPGSLKLHDELEKRGFACGIEVFPGLGHDFPQDFEHILPRVLDFVLGK